MTTDSTLLSRRRFLVLGGAAATTVAVPGVARGATGRTVVRTSWLDRRTFSRRRGETFVVRGSDGVSVATRLTGVGNVRGTTSRGRSLARRADAFILTFTPISGAPTGGQETRAFIHPELGSTQLFAAAGDTTYTVVINRSVPLGTASRWSSRAVRMGKRRARRARRGR